MEIEVFDPFEGIGVCSWCDDITDVGQYQSTGPYPVDICGVCIKRVGHLYTPWEKASG